MFFNYTENSQNWIWWFKIDQWSHLRDVLGVGVHQLSWAKELFERCFVGSWSFWTALLKRPELVGQLSFLESYRGHPKILFEKLPVLRWSRSQKVLGCIFDLMPIGSSKRAVRSVQLFWKKLFEQPNSSPRAFPTALSITAPAEL